MTVALVVVTFLAVVMLLVGEARLAPWRRAAKAAASTGFLAVAVSVGAADGAYGRAVLVALVLSWLGDLFLTYTSRAAFLAGLVAFLLGHVAYIAAFVIRGISPGAVLVAFGGVLIVAAVIWRWLRPHLESAMLWPVATYVAVISAMVAAAIGTAASDPDPRIVLGAAAFFVSDIAVARNRFVAPGFVNRAWGLPLYYLGQVLLALSTSGRA